MTDPDRHIYHRDCHVEINLSERTADGFKRDFAAIAQMAKEMSVGTDVDHLIVIGAGHAVNDGSDVLFMAVDSMVSTLKVDGESIVELKQMIAKMLHFGSVRLLGADLMEEE